jgi:hypothetical protein
MKIIISLLFLVSVACSSCGLDWVQGETLVLNGSDVVYNGLIFTAQNTPTVLDTPPVEAVDSYNWLYVGACVETEELLTGENLEAFMVGYGLAIFAGALGLGVGVVVKAINLI